MQSDIENLCEKTVVSHLNQSAGLLAGVTILTRVNDGTQDLPQIVVAATGSEESPMYSGNYMVDLDVMVRSNAHDTTRDAHNTRVGVVREELTAEWAGASITSHASNFTALRVVRTSNTSRVEEDSWLTVLGIKIPCRPSS